MNGPIQPVLPGVLDPGPPPRLTGGACPRCDRKFFPRPVFCPGCLDPVDPADLSPTGTLHSFTVVRTRAPFGLPQPYAVGYVDLDRDRLRIFSLLDPERTAGLSVGQRVTLRVASIGVDGSGAPCLRYYFSPEE